MTGSIGDLRVGQVWHHNMDDSDITWEIVAVTGYYGDGSPSELTLRNTKTGQRVEKYAGRFLLPLDPTGLANPWRLVRDSSASILDEILGV